MPPSSVGRAEGAVTAPPPPSGAVTANLRGSPTALRARWDSRSPSRPPHITHTVVVRAGRGRRAPSRCVLASHRGRLMGGVPDEDLVVLSTDPGLAEPPLLRRRVRVRLPAQPSSELAEEITASTFERALRPARLPLARRWLPGLALPHRGQRAGTSHRKAQRQHSGGDSARPPAARRGPRRQPALDAGDGAEVLQVLGQLNERYQRAISLRYLSGLAPRTRPTPWGWSKATFAVVLHRAMGRFARRSTSRREGAQNLAELFPSWNGSATGRCRCSTTLGSRHSSSACSTSSSRPPPRLSRSWLLPAAGAARCSWAEERSGSGARRGDRHRPGRGGHVRGQGGDRRRGHVSGRRQPNGAGRRSRALWASSAPVPKAPSPSRRRRSARIT